MIYSDFQNKKLSLLGFGTMRLPCLAEGSIDETQVAEMTRMAIEAGVTTSTPPTPTTAASPNG